MAELEQDRTPRIADIQREMQFVIGIDRVTIDGGTLERVLKASYDVADFDIVGHDLVETGPIFAPNQIGQRALGIAKDIQRRAPVSIGIAGGILRVPTIYGYADMWMDYAAVVCPDKVLSDSVSCLNPREVADQLSSRRLSQARSRETRESVDTLVPYLLEKTKAPVKT